MQFKVRDLMIDIARPDGIAIPGNCIAPTLPNCFPPSLCLTPTPCGICSIGPTWEFPPTGCGVNFSTCPAGSVFQPTTQLTTVIRTGTLQTGAVAATPQNLAVLRAELQQAIAQVEAQEQALEASLQPQTLEDAEMLEQKLSEALEEVRIQKEKLQG